MQDIENKLTDLIGKTDNDELMETWLQYLKEKKDKSDRLEKRITKKDPLIIGALLGALIGSLFSED